MQIANLPHILVTGDVEETILSMALESKIFKQWIGHPDLHDHFGLQRVHIRNVDFCGKPSPETVLFVHMIVLARNSPIRKVVILRGHTVTMLPILFCQGSSYTILAEEPRIAIAEFKSAGTSAGMTDGGSFRSAARREMGEELDLFFQDNEIFDITPPHIPVTEGIALSAGILDEQVRFYIATRVLSEDALKAIQGKATGLASEHEKIILKVIPLADLHKHTRDAKAFIMLALYELWSHKKY